MVHLYDYRQIFYRHNFKKRSRPEYLLTLREHMRCRQPINEAHHASLKIFVYKDLRNSIHVFLRHDAIRKPLQPTYDGPFRVVKRTDKTFTIGTPRGQKNVSIDRLKPAYLLQNWADTTTLGPQQPNPNKLPTQITTRFGRTMHFPKKFLQFLGRECVATFVDHSLRNRA